VVLAPFPFDGLSGVKVRPAVCLTDPLGFHHVVLAFITSQAPPDPLATDVLLDALHPDFARTGLHVTSTLRLHRLLTAHTTLIKRQLGELTPAFQSAVHRQLL